MVLKVCSAIIFAVASVSLYFGAGWVFIMPHFPGESYFTLERLLFGWGLTALSLVLFAGAGWTWSRSRGMTAMVAIRRSFSLGIGVISLYWLVLMIIGGIRQG